MGKSTRHATKPSERPSVTVTGADTQNVVLDLAFDEPPTVLPSCEVGLYNSRLTDLKPAKACASEPLLTLESSGADATVPRVPDREHRLR